VRLNLRRKFTSTLCCNNFYVTIRTNYLLRTCHIGASEMLQVNLPVCYWGFSQDSYPSEVKVQPGGSMTVKGLQTRELSSLIDKGTTFSFSFSDN
jgi:hypothetical protein